PAVGQPRPARLGDRRRAGGPDRRRDALRLARAPAPVRPVQLTDMTGTTQIPPAEVASRPPDPEPPEPQRPFRRRGVGPFSLRQVTLAILVVMGTAIVLTLATVPLGSTEPGLHVPDPSAFLIGSPIPGLDVGNLAPELEGDGPGGRVQRTDLNGAPIRLG